MKNLLTAVLGILCLSLFSCQKEVNPDGFNGGGNNNNNSTGLLSKMVVKSGSDSTVASFTYNSSNKLIAVFQSGSDAGTVIDTRESFIRNSQGIITQIITKNAELLASGIDSVISKVSYGGGRYTNRVSYIDFFGVFLFKDSAVFTYDGGGNIVTVEDLLDVGAGYEPYIKTEYTYSGKNIATVKTYSYDDTSSKYVEEYVETRTYDTKVSPLILGNEAFALNYNSWYSANNAIKSVTVSSTDPTLNGTQDVTYTYNSSNKPISGATVIQGGTTASITFTYN
jgi:hypothetical protein